MKARRGVAAVTGARRGIGRAIASSLASANFDIVAIDRVHDEEMESTLEEVKQRGTTAKCVVADISNAEGHHKVASLVFAAFGDVDCLVNNAGILIGNRGLDLLDVSIKDFDSVMDLNLRGTFFFTQAIAKKMTASKASNNYRSIITISSTAAGRAQTDTPEYSFSKTCLSLMSEMFALRMGREGVSTFDVRPGVIKTEMSRDVWPLYERLIANDQIPMSRMGEPEDVAETVTALACGSLRYTTGQTVYVAGGMQIGSAPIPRAKVQS